jgi:hypothetical protein
VNSYDFTILIVLGVALLGLVGYVMNIIKLATAKTVTGFVLLRVVGVFVPLLGALLGFF